MNILINYSDKNFKKSQKKNTRTGYAIGKFDHVISFSPKDIDKKFFRRNKKILKQKRGAGYWLWKPYIILETLRYMSKSDVLFYCDSGSHFIGSIVPLLKSFEKSKQDIMVFELLNCKENKWTKRDAFVLLDCEDEIYKKNNQIMGTFFACRKTQKSIDFVTEWLELCQNELLLTDKSNPYDFDEEETFKEHRHDQSILSLLAKKYKLKAFRDPSQYGNSAMKKYKNSKYKQTINLTRNRK